jgi:hypothetical protein
MRVTVKHGHHNDDETRATDHLRMERLQGHKKSFVFDGDNVKIKFDIVDAALLQAFLDRWFDEVDDD